MATIPFLETGRQRWLQLGNAARAALALATLALLSVCLALLWWLLVPEYKVLFSDLDAEDAGAVVSELERLKIPYRLRDDGRTVLTESDLVHKTRLKLMSKGNVNLRGTVGFELFADSDFGMTEFAQKINYQRALQGELARTIMSLEEVRQARVHLVLPESGLLKRAETRAEPGGKASITVTTQPGKRLQAAQVAGIQRLVAAAVPQIEPAAVTLLDSRGVALNPLPDPPEAAGGSGALGGSSQARLELKRQTESYFIQKAAAVLDRAIGPGRAIVTVDVSLNHDLLKVTQEQVLVSDASTGAGALLRRRQTTQKDGRGRHAPADAAPSEATAVPGASESHVEDTEYQHGKRIEQIVSSPGALRRISVAIVLPDVLPQSQADKLSEVVSMAVGLNRERGDGIAIYSMGRMTMAASQAGEDGVIHAFGPASGAASNASANAGGGAEGRVAPAGENLLAAASPGAKVGQSASRSSASTGAPEAGTNQVTLALGGLLTLSLLALPLLLWRQRHAGVRPLSQGDREAMLRELSEWLGPRASGGRR